MEPYTAYITLAYLASAGIILWMVVDTLLHYYRAQRKLHKSGKHKPVRRT